MNLAVHRPSYWQVRGDRLSTGLTAPVELAGE